MNYHQARQREDGSGWTWTTMNDGRVWPSGGCVTWPEGEPTYEDVMSGVRKPMGEPHIHATQEEAEQCFYDYERGRLKEFKLEKTTHQCEFPGCKKETRGGLNAFHLAQVSLCKKHRTPEGWSAARPFKPGISITASW